MQNTAAAQHYKTQELMTASPAKLVSMLYDHAIFALKDAIRAIEAGDIAGRHKANAKAMEIINHMDMTLDMDKGGEIAQNLSSIYSLVLRRLPQVDIKNDPQFAQEAIDLLQPLADSWRILADKGPNAATAPQPAAARPNGSTHGARQATATTPATPATPIAPNFPASGIAFSA